MGYREWKRWVGGLPWSMRWFVFIVLLRPVIDSFYSAKEISPLASPLFIVGGLMPVLCLLGILFNPSHKSDFDRPMFFLFLLAILNSVMLFTKELPIFFIFQSLLKFTNIFILFYFAKRLVRSLRDLEGIFQTYLYSMIYVLIILLFELLIHPIRLTQRVEGTLRIQGTFGDIASYGLYLNMMLIILFYRMARYQTRKWKNLTIAAIMLIGVAQFRINHITTLVTSMIIIIYNLRARILRNPGLVVLIVAVIIFIVYERSDSLQQLVGRDVSALQNQDVNIEQFGHGRVGRIESMYDEWINLDFFSKTFGIALFSQDFNAGFLWGTHDDFIRMIMLTGIAGLIIYLWFLLLFIRRSIKSPPILSTLGISFFLFLFCYSLSLTPLLYYPVCNILAPVW
ncbi:MAG TPA: hypothetical protein VMC08_08650, partial [Bacteroidales bacterium]|nr:hypothetical protein [Bacteroidales bacterium]